MTLYGIQPAQIDEVWADVAPDIEAAAATSRGKYSASDMREELRTGECQLWIWQSVTARAVIITQIHSYKRNKCCWIRVATGYGGDELKQAARTSVAIIERWAREKGCDAMELIARPGWSRLLKDYEMTHVYLERAL